MRRKLCKMHLVVVQHGLWGSSGNTAHLSLLLREQLGNGHFILNSDVNGGNLTYDGIDVCGDRLFALMLSTIDSLACTGNPVTAISLIGYSMGGLVTRYVVGKLYAEGYFRSITPANFITVATPHLGAWRMPSSWYNRAFNYMVPVVTSRSGYQLVLQDKHVWGKPLLCVMSHPDLLFMRALRLFKKLMLMANVFHDRPVPYCTAAIRLDNPYESSPPVPIDPKYASIVMTAAESAKAAAATAELTKGQHTNSGPTRSSAIIHGQEDAGPKAAPHRPAASDAASTAVTVLVKSTAVGMGYGTGCTTGVVGGDGGEGANGSSLAEHQMQQQQQHGTPRPLGAHSDGGTAAGERGQLPSPPPQQQQPPLRPLRSTYLRYLMILFLPLALPALLLMVITGRTHHSKIKRTALDFSWIERYHDGRGLGGEGDDDGGGGRTVGVPGQRSPGAFDGAVRKSDNVCDDKSSGDGDGGATGAVKRATGRMPSDIECPSAPDLPSLASATSAAAIAAAKLAAPAGSASGGGTVTAAPASATALGALDDGADGVVVSEQSVLLHDGIVELPAELHRVQEWLVQQLNQLPWHKVDVDCRDYHAHAAIIMRNPARFIHNRDVLDYLIDQFLRF